MLTMNKLKEEVLKRLSLILINEREINVGDEIKIAVANSDDVLVDFPKKIIADEILVDFPNRSENDSNSHCYDSFDEDDAFLDFPKEGRSRRLSAQKLADIHREREHTIPPNVVSFPKKTSNTTDPVYSSANTLFEASKTLIDNDIRQETSPKSIKCEIRGRSSHVSTKASVSNADGVHDHSHILFRVDDDEKTEDPYPIENKVETIEDFVKPSNWIDSEDSDSDEGSEAYRQRMYHEIESRKSIECSTPPPSHLAGNHVDGEDGESQQISVKQEPKVRPTISKSKSLRRPSMSMKVNTSASFSLDGNSPFSQGFEFAKEAPVVQMRQTRRQSITHTTYDFEKGMDARPRPARRNSMNNVDANLVSGLKAFGAKGHDIRRILA